MNIVRINSASDLQRFIGENQQGALAAQFKSIYDVSIGAIEIIIDWLEEQGCQIKNEEFYIIEGSLLTEYACLPDEERMKQGMPENGDEHKGRCKNYVYLAILSDDILNVDKIETGNRVAFGLDWVSDLITKEADLVYCMR